MARTENYFFCCVNKVNIKRLSSVRPLNIQLAFLTVLIKCSLPLKSILLFNSCFMPDPSNHLIRVVIILYFQTTACINLQTFPECNY